MLRFTEARVDIPFIKDHEIERDKKPEMPLPSNQGVMIGGGPGGLLGHLFGGMGIQPFGAPELSNQEKEKRIKTITDLGANKQQAQTLLQRFGWNTDLAGAIYFESKQI